MALERERTSVRMSAFRPLLVASVEPDFGPLTDLVRHPISIPPAFNNGL